MSKINKTEEDWFLRGGERPSTKTPYDEPQVPNEGNPHDTDPCTECDGLTRCDDCPHNRELVEDDETGNDDGETRKFRVRVTATRLVKTFVTVEAVDEEDACDTVADQIVSGDFDSESHDWEPAGDSVFDPEIDDTDVTEV